MYKRQLLTELKKRLNENCMDFSENENADGDLEPELPAGEKEQQNLMENKFSEEFLESLAMCDEKLLEKYLETGEVSRGEITDLIADRKVFPCYFGSALRMEGVEKLIHGLDRYTRCPVYPEAFGAKVYKIARDDQGNRLSYMKITCLLYTSDLSTMQGLFPPSSRVTGVRCSLAWRMTSFPTAWLPVKKT